MKVRTIKIMDIRNVFNAQTIDLRVRIKKDFPFRLQKLLGLGCDYFYKANLTEKGDMEIPFGGVNIVIKKGMCKYLEIKE